MAFQFVRNLISNMSPVAPPGDVFPFKDQDNSGGLAAGVVCDMHATAGHLNIAAAQSQVPAVITVEAIAQNGEGRAQWVLPGSVYKVPVRKADGTKFTAVPGTGTNGIAATTVLGARLRITTDGKAADGANASDKANPLTVVKIERSSDSNAAETVAWVVFNQGLLFKGNVNA